MARKAELLQADDIGIGLFEPVADLIGQLHGILFAISVGEEPHVVREDGKGGGFIIRRPTELIVLAKNEYGRQQHQEQQAPHVGPAEQGQDKEHRHYQQYRNIQQTEQGEEPRLGGVYEQGQVTEQQNPGKHQ